jgi:hypothetical protein
MISCNSWDYCKILVANYLAQLKSLIFTMSWIDPNWASHYEQIRTKLKLLKKVYKSFKP